jgi:hypothetical protein
MKFYLQRLINDQQASITVFLSVFFVMLIIFYALILDILLIHLNKRESMLAIQASARSVLSRFDAKLRSYGLFAFELQHPEISKIVSEILRADHLQGSWNISASNHLANKEVLLKQIIEDMKWRAPVAWIDEFSQKWRTSGADQLSSQGNQLTDATKILSSLFSKRKLVLDALDAMIREAEMKWQQQRDQAIQTLQQLLDRLNELITMEQTIAKWTNLIPGVSHLTNINLIESMKTQIEQVIILRSKPIDSFFSNVRTEISKINIAESNTTPSNATITNRWFPVQCRGIGKLKQQYNVVEEKQHTAILKQTNKASDWMQAMTNMMKKTTGAVRDELMLNEYIVQMFNHRLSPSDHHQLKQQEIEFILKGSSSCDVNMFGVLTDLFLLRVLIRMLEFISSPELYQASIVNPWSFLVATVSYGVIHAGIDVSKLIAGEQVPFFERKLGAKFTLNYKDYLRLFLMVTPKTTKLERIQLLIESNTQRKLKDHYVDVQLSAVFRYKLILIPERFRSIALNTSYDYQ